MYSVLILNQRTMELFHEYHSLFMEVLDDNKIGVCRWVESGTSVETALPELTEMISDKESWRAIIVRVEDEEGMRQFRTNPYNPYDFMINHEENQKEDQKEDQKEGKEINLESPVPLVRLTQMLGGVPAPDMEFESELLHEPGKAPRVIYKPIKSEEKEAARQRLVNQYDFDGKMPEDVILYSFHFQAETASSTEVKSVWSNRNDLDSSEFWKRNNYPSSCRFAVYPYRKFGVVQKNADLFNFWISVQMLLLNRIDPSTLQAYRLYRINTTLKKSVMIEQFQRKVFSLEAAKVTIAQEIKKDIAEQLNKKSFRPDFETSLHVELDMPTSEQITIDPRSFDAIAASTGTETRQWDEMRTGSLSMLSDAYKRAERSLDECADKVRMLSQMPEEEVLQLDHFQREDLQAQLDGLFERIFQKQDRLPKFEQKQDEEVADITKRVREEIATRLDSSRVFILAGVIILMTLFTMVPGWIYRHFQPIGSPYAVVAYGAIMLFALGCIGTLVILIQKNRLSAKIDEFNDELNEDSENLSRNVGTYSDFVSDIVSYGRGSSYLRILKYKQFKKENSIEVLQTHGKALQALLDKIEAWSKAYHLSVVFDKEVEKEVYFDVSVAPLHNTFYSVEPGKNCEAALNHTGEKIMAPYEFIERLNIVREVLYDDPVSGNSN